MKLLASIWLVFVIGLAAQTPPVHVAAQTPPVHDVQTLAGSLVTVRHDSIAVKLNDKITTVHITPDTEIWRRGVDLTDPSQLVLGDDIYVSYTRTATDGAPIATLVASPQEGHTVRLIPHDVAESTACAGELTVIGANTISIKNDDGLCIMRFTPDTTFWRGETFHNPSGFVIGDQVGARAIVNYPSGELVAEGVWANIAKFRGTIAKAGPGGVELAVEDEQGEPDGTATVFFDEHTIFDEGTLKELQAGAFLEVIGLDLGHDSMRATRVLHLQAPVPPPSPQR